MRTAPRRGRLLIGLTVAAVAAAGLVPLGTVVTTAAPARAAVPTEQEAPDFASEVYHDPWDYSGAEDQNTDLATTAKSIGIGNGKLSMTVTAGSYFSPVSTIAGSIVGNRDGQAQPIDSSRYQDLSFSMTENASGPRIGAIYWFTCADLTAACTGGRTFSVTPGTNTYDIDLANVPAANRISGANTAWTSAKIVSFRIQPVVLSTSESASVSFDWMRLHAPATASTPHADLPPGDYGSFTVTSTPEPIVDSPNPDEGQDVTSVLGRHAWDFTSSAGAAGVSVQDATVSGYGASGMTATNAGPSINDPRVLLAQNVAFSGSQFHNLSFDMTYDGGFSLADAPGGGKMARVLWNTASTSTTQIGGPMVTWSSGNGNVTYRYDLNGSTVLDKDTANPRVGWAGQTITSLRFDPNEDPSANTWHLKDVHLRADPAATGSTTVKFHDAAWVAGTTANVLVGTGAPGSAYTTIASGVSVSQGTNSVPFALGGLSSGAYHVEVQMFHPNGAGATGFSSSVIDMTRDGSHDPKGSFDSAGATSPTTATLSGWDFDPDATGPSTVDVWDQTGGSRYLASVQTSIARTDVQRAYPSAPLNTGWKATVTLSSGTHTLCAYGINVPNGGGPNPLLGCRTVTVTNQTPLGSFDSIAGTLSGATVNGWAFDPDSSSPIQVAFYDQTGASKELMNVTTSLPRTDVQRVHPGAPANSGWTANLALTPGTHTICVYAINTPDGGTNPMLGCKTVAAGGTPARGSLDSVAGGTGSVTVSGWAFDPDATGPLQVDVWDQTAGNRYVGGTTTTVARPDVQRSVAGAGPTTGYVVTLPESAGGHTVCAYAINQPAGGANPLLGCRSVTVR